MNLKIISPALLRTRKEKSRDPSPAQTIQEGDRSMININDLSDNAAELLHEAIDKDKADPAFEPREETEPSGGLSEDALAALCGKLLSGQRCMQDEIDALRAELTAEAKKTAFLRAELDEARAIYVKNLLKDEPPPPPKENHCLRTVGVAALLTPLIFGGGSLASLALQRWAGSWGAAGGTLLACIACVVLGLLLLLLAKCGSSPLQTLLHWLADDDWPEGPKEEFVGKENHK